MAQELHNRAGPGGPRIENLNNCIFVLAKQHMLFAPPRPPQASCNHNGDYLLVFNNLRHMRFLPGFQEPTTLQASTKT